MTCLDPERTGNGENIGSDSTVSPSILTDKVVMLSQVGGVPVVARLRNTIQWHTIAYRLRVDICYQIGATKIPTGRRWGGRLRGEVKVCMTVEVVEPVKGDGVRLTSRCPCTERRRLEVPFVATS